jgi:hypothetical protein
MLSASESQQVLQVRHPLLGPPVAANPAFAVMVIFSGDWSVD